MCVQPFDFEHYSFHVVLLGWLVLVLKDGDVTYDWQVQNLISLMSDWIFLKGHHFRKHQSEFLHGIWI